MAYRGGAYSKLGLMDVTSLPVSVSYTARLSNVAVGPTYGYLLTDGFRFLFFHSTFSGFTFQFMLL